jgi:hypothetical protein
MGNAVWLFGWLLLRQTTEGKDQGLVLRGKPITYHFIEQDTGFLIETVRRWLRTLRRAGYISTQQTRAGLRITIQKAKKFNRVLKTEQSQGCSDINSQDCSSLNSLGCSDLNGRVFKSEQLGCSDLNGRVFKSERQNASNPSEISLMPTPIERERKKDRKGKKENLAPAAPDSRHAPVRDLIQRLWLKSNPNYPSAPWAGFEGKALKTFFDSNPSWTAEQIVACVENRFASEVNHAERPSAWIRNLAQYAGGPLDRFNRPRQPKQDNSAGTDYAAIMRDNMHVL